MSDLKDALAETLADAIERTLESKSQADLTVPFARGRVTAAIITAIEGALSASGVAVTQLPEPGEDGEWHVQDVGSVGVYRGETGVIGHFGVDIRDVGLDLVTAPAEAREFAAAILAAAVVSEGEAR